jgi:hypothetical protein
MVLREDQAKATYTQKVDFAKLRSELLSADSAESSTTRASQERLSNELAKLNSRLRDEISRTQASVRLDLNLEKGRIREEANVQELKIKETETKIEQEVAGLREKLEGVKFQTLQWLMGVCTGKHKDRPEKWGLMLIFYRYRRFDSWCLEIVDVDIYTAPRFWVGNKYSCELMVLSNLAMPQASKCRRPGMDEGLYWSSSGFMKRPIRAPSACS